MLYHPLSATCVEFLDNLPQSSDSWEEIHAEFSEDLRWAARYFTSQEDREEYDSFQQCYAGLNGRLRSGASSPAQLHNLDLEMERFQQRLQAFKNKRSQSIYIAIPELDSLLNCLISSIEGLGGAEALEELVECAMAKVDKLAKTHASIHEDLPDQVKLALTNGFRACYAAFVAIERCFNGTEVQGLRKACTDLRDGGKILEYISNWELDYEKEYGFDFPVAGAEARRLIEKGQLKEFCEGPLEELWLDWEQRAWQSVLLPESERLYAEIPQTLESFLECDIAQAVQLCKHLESLYRSLAQEALPLESEPTSWNYVAHYLAAAQAGRVSRLCLGSFSDRLAGMTDPQYQNLSGVLGSEPNVENCYEALLVRLSLPAPIETESSSQFFMS